MKPVLRICFLLIFALGSLSQAAERVHSTTEQYPSAAGKRLLVDAATLDLHVRAADVREIEVATDLRIAGVSEERAERWIAQHTPEVRDEAGRLSIVAKPGQSGFLGLGLLTARAKLRMICPRDVIPDLTTTRGSVTLRGDFADPAPVQLRTASGDVEFEGAAQSIDVRTASGDTTIEVIRPLERLFVRSSSGSLNLTGGARSTHVDTSSGDIRLVNLSGSVEVETSTGKITVRWDRIEPDHTVVLQSDSGRINIVLPRDASPRGTLSTASGAIRSGFPGIVDESGVSVSLKGTGPLLTVTTISGEILLTPAEE